MKKLLLLLGLVGCATAPVPYHGPATSGILVEQRDQPHFDIVSDPRRPRWVMLHFVRVVNAGKAPAAVRVECEHFIETLSLPARTSEEFLRDHGDVCNISFMHQR